MAPPKTAKWLCQTKWWVSSWLCKQLPKGAPVNRSGVQWIVDHRQTWTHKRNASDRTSLCWIQPIPKLFFSLGQAIPDSRQKLVEPTVLQARNRVDISSMPSWRGIKLIRLNPPTSTGIFTIKAVRQPSIRETKIQRFCRWKTGSKEAMADGEANKTLWIRSHPFSNGSGSVCILKLSGHHLGVVCQYVVSAWFNSIDRIDRSQSNAGLILYKIDNSEKLCYPQGIWRWKTSHV